MLKSARRTAVSRAAALLGAALVCAAISNALAGPERRLEWIRKEGALPGSPPAAGAPGAPTNPAWVEISGEEAARRLESGAIFFDARRSNEYRGGHIAGARSLSVWEAGLDEGIQKFFAEGHPPAENIVVYCNGGECEDSHTLAQKLFLAGFDHVAVYRDGFPDWKRRGLPVHQGDQP
ncbi:MAG TPA: rhodanese-like domain-containing protein [Thermoanaerobaculia bacterium]|nr:rhodanese-like domain-containing protein [Thermoanaerobaculia bacterium]